MQQEFDFLHSRENNSHSQAILEENYERLNAKCQLTLDLLRKGVRLTVRSALLDYGISSLPRRILDLKEKGIDVKSEMTGRFKEYYL